MIRRDWIPILCFIFICLHPIYTDDCSQCHQSYYKCSICYSNCSSFHFNSCSNRRGESLTQNECVQECCSSNEDDEDDDDHHHGSPQTFSSASLNSCLIKNSQNENNLVKVGYFAILAVGSFVALILFIVIARAIYKRATSPQRRQVNRISPIISQNSNLNLQDNMQNYQNKNQQNAQKKDFPPNCDQIIKDQSNTCCICLDGNITSITKCGHVFHLDCLAAWCNRKNSCPLCNYKKINQTKIYCSECKELKKTIDLKKSSTMEIQILRRGGCKNCKG